MAKEVIFSCDQCKFITINKRKFELHILNHDYTKLRNSSTAPTTTVTNNNPLLSTSSKSIELMDEAELAVATITDAQHGHQHDMIVNHSSSTISMHKQKIKVKSNLALAEKKK